MEEKLVAPPGRSSLRAVEQLWEAGGVWLVRCRLAREAGRVLLVMPVQEHPPAAILQRLEHE
jgi:hypothetical protein